MDLCVLNAYVHIHRVDNFKVDQSKGFINRCFEVLRNWEDLLIGLYTQEDIQDRKYRINKKAFEWETTFRTTFDYVNNEIEIWAVELFG